mgnify:CR=1 FL=1
MNTTVNDMLAGSEFFNTEYLPYSWLIPAVLFIITIGLTGYSFRYPGTRSSTALKLFLALVYLLSGLSVWLGMQHTDMKSAISGTIILWLYGVLFLLDALWWRKIIFRIPRPVDLRIAMILLMLMGLFYPVFELSLGYYWPRMVLFGSECPTTTFVIGLLTGSLPKTNKWILGILATNAVLVGGYVGLNGFLVDAITYFPAGIVGWIMMIRYWKTTKIKTT